MFRNIGFVLSSSLTRDASGTMAAYAFEPLAARRVPHGFEMKDSRGNPYRMRAPVSRTDEYLLLQIRQTVFGVKSLHTFTTEDIFAERIITYLRSYYGKRYTNCSTLAEYLRTGTFVECDREKRNFTFSGSLNLYRGEEVRPGDTVCTLYFGALATSRALHKTWRSHYRESEKNMHDTQGRLQGRKEKSRVTAAQLIEIQHLPMYDDYHFMFCIGIIRGEPVFIQQMGRNYRKEEELSRSPIVMSVGMTNVTHYDVPAAVFIKRGKV